jgi:hypothetical protein
MNQMFLGSGIVTTLLGIISWRVFKKHKKSIILPVIAVIVGLLLLLSSLGKGN